MVVLRPDGTEVGRTSGYVSPEDLENALRVIVLERERLWKVMRKAFARASDEVPAEDLDSLLRRWLELGWVAEAARLAAHARCGENPATAALAWEARTRIHAATYEVAAWSGRASGWSRIELPERFKRVADPELHGLLEACRVERGPVGEALRTALRRARREVAAELVRKQVEVGVWEGGWPKIIRFAVAHGCAAEVVRALEAFMEKRGAAVPDKETMRAAVAAAVAAGGPPRAARRLVGPWIERVRMVDESAARALYLAGEREREVNAIIQLQRRGLEVGVTVWVHRLGRERREMLAGVWRPPPAPIEGWPSP